MLTRKVTKPPSSTSTWVDRLQAFVFYIQMANVGLTRFTRAFVSWLLILFVLPFAVGWKPWHGINRLLDRADGGRYEGANGEYRTFHIGWRADPIWRVVWILAIVVGFHALIRIAVTREDENKQSLLHRIPMFARWYLLQLFSNPIGTLMAFAVFLLAGGEPLPWRWKKPWLWRPVHWNWDHIGLTFVLMLVVFIVPLVVMRLMWTYAEKTNRRPNRLILHRRLIDIIITLPALYAAADVSPERTDDIVGRAERLPKFKRELGVSMITSFFASFWRYPVVKLIIRPAYGKRWDDLKRLAVRFNLMLGNRSPHYLDVSYSDEKARRGTLVIHFAPRNSPNVMSLIPLVPIGGEEFPPESRRLTLVERIALLSNGATPIRLPNFEPTPADETVEPEQVEAVQQEHEVEVEPSPTGAFVRRFPPSSTGRQERGTSS